MGLLSSTRFSVPVASLTTVCMARSRSGIGPSLEKTSIGSTVVQTTGEL